MKKKILSLVLVLIMCVSVFAGCSLFEINEKNYYETVVATLTYNDGVVDNIDKRELLLAYSSYGYNYVQNYGYSYEKAIDETLKSIVDQRATIKAVKDYYEKNPQEGEVLNDNETSYLWNKAYTSIIAGIEKEYFEILDVTQKDASEEENSSSDVVYTPYNSNVEFKEKTIKVNKRNSDGEFIKDSEGNYVKEEKTQPVIVNKTTPTTIRTDKNNLLKTPEGKVYDLRKDEFKDMLYNNIINQYKNSSNSTVRAWENAIRDYIKNLKDSYSYLTMNDEEWLRFEIDRIYDILERNYLVEKYTTIFNKNNNREDGISNITITDVLNHYSSKVRADYNTYYTLGDSETFASDMLSKVADVDYILDNGIDYFYVGAIKVNFSTLQLKDVENENKNGNVIEKEENLKEILSQNNTNVNLQSGNDEIHDDIENVDNLYKYLADELNNIKYRTAEDVSDDELDGKDLGTYLSEQNALIAKQKAEIFRNYMFSYSDENSLKNADRNLVFGYNLSSKEIVASESYNKDDIKEEIGKFFRKDNKVIQPQIGDLTAPVKTDDGYYIFFFAGNIENLFPVGDNFALTREESVYKLTSTYPNIFSNKTMFDVLYEELVKDNFTEFQNLDIDNIRNKFITKEEWFSNYLYN